MSIEENKDLVHRFIATLHEGKFELLADDGTFWVAGSLPVSGTKSKQQMIDLFASLGGISDEKLVMKPKSMIAEGEHVSVEAVASMKLKDGRVYSNQYHILFTVRNGRVASVREYSDTAHMRDVFGG